MEARRGRRYFPAAGARPAPVTGSRAGRVKIEKLKQKLIDLKQQAQEEKQQLFPRLLLKYVTPEMLPPSLMGLALAGIRKKVREIGILELKLIKEFLSEKAAMEKELKDTVSSAGKEELPQMKTFKTNINSTNSVYRELEEAEKCYKFEKADISELTWEQKERVLLFFARMNVFYLYSTENTSPNLIFITQQAKLSDSSSTVILPRIQVLTPQIEQGSRTLLREQQPQQLPTHLHFSLWKLSYERSCKF
ncbi:LOW QUALITY PROTEIN: basal body-orientation factor 1 [Pluvialis apricaria]